MTGRYPISKMPPDLLRKALFFAETEAGLYDHDIQKVVPEYQLAHRVLLDLVAARFRELGSESTRGSILDIGAGSGQEALAIINRLPGARVVAIDLSQAILGVFEEKLRTRPDIDGRCQIVCADITSSECSVDGLLEKLPPSERDGGYLAVVSAFALHHLEHEEKMEVFQRIYSVLSEDGMFANLDLFTFRDTHLARQALDFDLSWIEHQFGLLDEDTAPDTRRSGELWREHYIRYNFTEPIEGFPTATDGPGQEAMLRGVGFRDVAIPFRYWQSGIFWARK